MIMEKKWDLRGVKKAVMVAWALWTNRNEVRHKRKQKDGNALVYGAMDHLIEYQTCVDNPVICLKHACNLVSPPPLLCDIKLMWTVRCLVHRNQWGVGVVIKDAEGSVMGASCKKN